MSKYISVRELAKILNFEVVGKLKRISDRKYGFGNHYPVYVDEAGNEYLLNKVGGVTPGCIVEANGRIH